MLYPGDTLAGILCSGYLSKHYAPQVCREVQISGVCKGSVHIDAGMRQLLPFVVFEFCDREFE
jgi:hypothetical protein